jgi:uncharacterized protein (DUF488 family)
MRLYTIGHSTRSSDELAALLRDHDIALLADIRRYPGSKRYPHFASEAMAAWLPEHGVAYLHMPELGGRRKALPDSPNTAWRNEQFRAYADYMVTDAAIMCAEAVPWRCHRNLVADELARRGIEVVHIIGTSSVKTHAMNEHAVVEGDHLIYPAEQHTLRL